MKRVRVLMIANLGGGSSDIKLKEKETEWFQRERPS